LANVGSRAGHLTALLVLVAAVGLLASVPARAADRVYWGNNAKISFANLDGSGGADLNTGGAPVNGAEGLAIDSAAGRLYWGNYSPGTSDIRFANLDGSGGGGQLNTTGAQPAEQWGLAIDPVGGRMYWARSDGHVISFARLDGGGGADLPTTGATTNSPEGVAIDVASGRIYWGDYPDKISFARLDGSGGGNLNTTGATVDGVNSMALDVAAGRIYWANQNANSISFARLDGSGGSDLTITGATVDNPIGIAVDPVAGKVYWANSGTTSTISFANLDGSGGGTVNSTGANVSESSFPILLRAPVSAGAPQIAGGSVPGAVLSCSPGAWAPDLLGSQLYRAPQSFGYQWSRDGAAIPGAVSASLTASGPGDYRCTVTGANQAGSAAQASAAHTVLPAFGGKTLVSLVLAARRISSRGPVRIRIHNGNTFQVVGSLSGATAHKVRVSRLRRVKLKTKSFVLAPRATKAVELALPRSVRDVLKHKHKVTLRLSAKLKDPAGDIRVVKKRVSPRLRKRHAKR
jgi:hypothetical protein